MTHKLIASFKIEDVTGLDGITRDYEMSVEVPPEVVATGETMKILSHTRHGVEILLAEVLAATGNDPFSVIMAEFQAMKAKQA